MAPRQESFNRGVAREKHGCLKDTSLNRTLFQGRPSPLAVSRFIRQGRRHRVPPLPSFSREGSMVKITTLNDRPVRHVRYMPDCTFIRKLYERRPGGRADGEPLCPIDLPHRNTSSIGKFGMRNLPLAAADIQR